MEALSKQNIHSRIGSSLMNQLMMAGEFPLLISQYPTGVEELKNRRAHRLGTAGPLVRLPHRHRRHC